MAAAAPKKPAGEVDVMHTDDIQSVAELRAEAFAEKACWVCCESRTDGIRENIKVYNEYVKVDPVKLSHCFVIRDDKGKVLSACQLQMKSDVGDFLVPCWLGMRHTLTSGECYLEWIGASEAARGKGYGSKLIKHSLDFAQREGCAKMTLEVMAVNRAMGLYERLGFVVKAKSACTKLGECVFIWVFMGCKYTSAIKMEKPLSPSDAQAANPVPPPAQTQMT